MLEELYNTCIGKRRTLLVALLLLLLLMAFAFMTLGLQVSWLRPVEVLSKAISGIDNLEPIDKIILLLRMPRIGLALVAGMGLALAGAVMQCITRNYLVSPFTLGISSSAAFGASLCIVFGTGALWQSNMAIVGCAFLASCLCGAVVYLLAGKIGLRPNTIILVGIALNYFFSALTASIEFFAQEHKLEAVVQWTFGSFNKATWENVLLGAVILLLSGFLIKGYRLQLFAIACNDDETAQSLGIQVGRVRAVCGLAAVLLTAAIISFTGVIGFVGLIAPHMARLLHGINPETYLPLSALLGAVLLLLADTIGKLILYPVNIPVGIVISFIGVPLFIHLIVNKNNQA